MGCQVCDLRRLGHASVVETWYVVAGGTWTQPTGSVASQANSRGNLCAISSKAWLRLASSVSRHALLPALRHQMHQKLRVALAV